jgi:hypothetical protein
MSLIARVRLVSLVLGWLLVLGLAARGSGPADGLFRLVPPDAAATLAIEDLRGQAREFLASPTAASLRHRPEFQAWLASTPFARFQQAGRKIEAVLGETVSTLRDELLGDAVVLTLRAAPGGRPEEARGLLLVRVGNRPLLDRLVQGLNEAQLRSGELQRLVDSRRAGVLYRRRAYRPDTQKPDEYYTILDDNTLAWSNAEDLIQGVIDRGRNQAPSLADLPKFQQVRRRLPPQAAVSLFLEPSFVWQRLETAPRNQKPGADRMAALLGRYFGAMEFLGVALEWRDGIVLHSEELLDPHRLDPWIRQWAERPAATPPGPGAGPSSRRVRVPASALAMASVHLDFPALLSALSELVPPNQEPRLENLVVTMNGVLLGHDLRTEILPNLGPRVFGYLEAPAQDAATAAPGPGPGRRLAKVLVVELGNATGLTAALENALQTFLAFYALDPRHGNGRLQLESRDVDGQRITSLRPASGSPLAFAVDRDRLVLGSTPAAVAGALAPGPVPARADVPAEGPFEQLRAAEFPQAGSFACVDLVGLHRYVRDHRAALVARLAARQGRTAEEAGRDVDQAVLLMGLFRQGYLTSTVEPDATSVHRSVGLLVREPARTPVPATAP